MRKIYLLQFLLVLSIFTNGQNLTINELIQLEAKSKVAIEEFLTNKGWVFLRADDGGEEKLSEISFAYKKNINSNKSEAFFAYWYNSKYSYKAFALQFHNPSKYQAYLSELKKIGFVIKSSEVQGVDYIKVYSRGSLEVKITIKESKDSDEYNNTHTNYYIEVEKIK